MKEEIYDENHFETNYPNGIQDNYWNVARNKFIASNLKNEKGIVLDIGCGRGIVVNYLRKNTINCYGVEFGNSKPIDSKDKEFLFLNKNAFELDKNFKNSVTTILLLDVLEHMKNPNEFLKNCLIEFPNISNICISLPARMELWTNYDEFYGHYKRYNFDNSLELLNGVNFKFLKKQYFFHLLYFPILITKYFGKGRQTEFKPPKGLLKIIHLIIGKLFYLESILLPNFLPGSSLWLELKMK